MHKKNAVLAVFKGVKRSLLAPFFVHFDEVGKIRMSKVEIYA